MEDLLMKEPQASQNSSDASRREASEEADRALSDALAAEYEGRRDTAAEGLCFAVSRYRDIGDHRGVAAALVNLLRVRNGLESDEEGAAFRNEVGVELLRILNDRAIRRIIMEQGLRQEDVDDIILEMAWKVLQRRPTVLRQTLFPFLRKMAKNAAIDASRRRVPTPVSDEELVSAAGLDYRDPAKLFADAELSRAVERTLGRMPKDEADILRFIYADRGSSYGRVVDFARAHGLDDERADALLRRSRRRFRAVWTESGGDSVPKHRSFDSSAPALAALAYRVARTVLSSDDDARDVCQTTMAAWFATAQHPPADIEAWVTTVSRRLAQQTIRMKASECLTARKLAALDGAHALNQDENHVIVESIVIERLIDELLPQQQKLAVRLRLIEGFDRASIAEAMGLSVETVKTHLSRGLKTLRHALNSSSDEIDTKHHTS
jgi:RNA polymerase sigma-70 factor (ECF subfamily)